MRHLITWSIALGFLLVCALPARAADDNWKLVINVKGTVEYQQAGSSDWTGIMSSRLLPDGAKVRTLADSRAKIRLADQSVITMGANTQVEMTGFTLTPTSRIVHLNLLSGFLRVNAAKFAGKDATVEVRSPAVAITTRGADFFVYQKKRTKGGGLDAADVDNLCGLFSGDIVVTPLGGSLPPNTDLCFDCGVGETIGADGSVTEFDFDITLDGTLVQYNYAHYTPLFPLHLRDLGYGPDGDLVVPIFGDLGTPPPPPPPPPPIIITPITPIGPGYNP